MPDSNTQPPKGLDLDIRLPYSLCTTVDQQLCPSDPSKPLTTPPAPPLSPQEDGPAFIDTAQILRERIALEEEWGARLQADIQLLQEWREKHLQNANLQQKLDVLRQPTRFCQHCHIPLFTHLPDGTLEPCTRSNRFSCGYDGGKRLVGNLDCIRKRYNAKKRRQYAARQYAACKARKQAEKLA
jgi:hypothetical protein